ncbi:MAG: diguanylate cyclase [Gammaproteobacteria bacterium]|nr:diguanylate cyclase [Gammaproteobacteria bacterium]
MISDRERQALPDFEQIVEAANDVVVITTAPAEGEPVIVYVNAAFCALTGYGPSEVMGRNPRFLQGDDRDQAARKELRDAIRNRRDVRTRIRNYDKAGRSYWLEISMIPIFDRSSGKVTHFAAIERDISQAVAREAALQEKVLTDELTGLLNRRGFDEALASEHARMQRYSRPYSLVMFDLDHFKSVNDDYGHAAGDLVLEGIGDFCRSSFREQDIVARIGGEEFCAILPETDVAGACVVAERLRAEVASSVFSLEAMSLKVTVSVGVAAADPGSNSEALMARVDAALYRAKDAGRNQVVRDASSEDRDKSE